MSPRDMGELPRGERRRWIVAATVTGVMLTSHPMVRGEVRLTDLPDGIREAIADDPATETLFDADAPVIAAASVSPASARPAVERRPYPGPPAGRAVPTATTVSATAEYPGDATADAGALPDGPVEIARFGDVTVAAEGAGVELVGFHESSSSRALPFELSEQPGRTAGGDAHADDGPIVVLPSRDRVGAPTSAIDVAMAPDVPVTAPISGEVIEVADFILYGTTRDLLVSIRSAQDPSIVLTVMHLVDAQVSVGDQVEAGRTPVAAAARQLPFASQIDRFAAAHRGRTGPHIHLELRRD